MVGNGWGVGGIAPSPEVMHRHPRACMPHCCALLICRSATTCITNTVSTTRAILAQFLRCGIEWQVATVELAWHIAQRLTAVLTCVRVRTRVFTRAVEAVYFSIVYPICTVRNAQWGRTFLVEVGSRGKGGKNRSNGRVGLPPATLE